MARLNRTGYGRSAVLLLTGAYFLVPIACAIAFSIGIGAPARP